MKRTIWCVLAAVFGVSNASVWASTFEVCRPDAAAQCVHEFRAALKNNFVALDLDNLQGALLQSIALEFGASLQQLQIKSEAMRDLDTRLLKEAYQPSGPQLMAQWRESLRDLEKDYKALAVDLAEYLRPLTTARATEDLRANLAVQAPYRNGSYHSQVVLKTWHNHSNWLGTVSKIDELDVLLTVDPYFAEICLRDAQNNGICSELDLLNEKPASYVAISSGGTRLSISLDQAAAMSRSLTTAP